jgi:hypothetical protein
MPRFELIDHRARSFVRHDEGAERGIHVTGREDVSPRYRGSTMSLACGWCYLGAPHSEQAHERKVSEHDGQPSRSPTPNA